VGLAKFILQDRGTWAPLVALNTLSR